MIKSCRYFVILACTVLIASCGSSASINSSINSDTLTFNDITKSISENSGKIKSFEGDGSIDFDSPENSSSASINVKRDALHDSIYTRISGIFGITGALITLNPVNFVYYNVQNAYVITGSTTKDNLNSILKINIGYEELRNLICASFNFDTSFHTESINSNDVSYILSGYRSGILQKYYIDSKNKYVTKFISFDNKRNIEYEAEYGDYRLTGGIFFPMDISFSIPAKNENVKLSYSSVNLNPAGLKFNFKIANNATVYRWK